VAVTFDPTPSTPPRLRAAVSPAWDGDAQVGAEALWATDALQHAGSVEPAGDRLDRQVGYGLPLGAQFVGTPRLGVTTLAHGRLVRFGYAVGTLTREDIAVDVGVDAQAR